MNLFFLFVFFKYEPNLTIHLGKIFAFTTAEKKYRTKGNYLIFIPYLLLVLFY